MVLAVICSNKIIIANIGDSRAVLGRLSNKTSCCEAAIPLTVDHKPSTPSERLWIISSGGRVFPIKYTDGTIGPDRVWLGNRNTPGLAMSRSLCDTVVHAAGVVSTPEVTERLVDLTQDPCHRRALGRHEQLRSSLLLCEQEGALVRGERPHQGGALQMAPAQSLHGRHHRVRGVLPGTDRRGQGGLVPCTCTN